MLNILYHPRLLGMHCCYGGIENDFDFFGPNWSLRHENLEKLIKTVHSLKSYRLGHFKVLFFYCSYGHFELLE